jgi:hypothetical protein
MTQAIRRTAIRAREAVADAWPTAAAGALIIALVLLV